MVHLEHCTKNKILDKLYKKVVIYSKITGFMLNKQTLRRIAKLIVWAKHSKPGPDHISAPHDLTHREILKTANELDGWLQHSFNKENYETQVSKSQRQAFTK